jgi:hypothetical protein
MDSLAPPSASVTKLDDLLGDVLAYAGAAAVGQALSHHLLARDPQLPATWADLVIRYSAGSGIVAAVLTTYGLRHPHATARDAAVMHWGVLLGCGAAVCLLHLNDWHQAQAVAREMDAAYELEDSGHVARPKARPPFPLSIYRGA